jgi:hypothetical protein
LSSDLYEADDYVKTMQEDKRKEEEEEEAKMVEQNGDCQKIGKCQ